MSGNQSTSACGGVGYVPVPSHVLSRETGTCLTVTRQQYKAEILQCKQNRAQLSRAQQYSMLSRNALTRKKSWATQTQTYTNPNVDNLPEIKASVNGVMQTVHLNCYAIPPTPTPTPTLFPFPGRGAGGGGAGQAGQPASNNGNGGDGAQFDIIGVNTYYAGGGGGGTATGAIATGGLGGGGQGGTQSNVGTSGTNGTGGGGGGGGGTFLGGGTSPGNGGSGIIVIRVPSFV